MNTRPRITFQPSGASVEAAPGTPLLTAASAAGVVITTDCGGEGTCGSCMVRVANGAVEHDSAGFLPGELLERGFVLACKAHVAGVDATIETAGAGARPAGQTGQFAESAPLTPIRVTADADDPPVIKRRLTVPPAQLEDGLSDLDRLQTAIRIDLTGLPFEQATPQTGVQGDYPPGGREPERGQSPLSDLPLPLLRTLAQTLRAESGRVTVTLSTEDDGLHIADVEPGDTTWRHMGLAVDIGTTSVAVQLIDLRAGSVLETRSGFNAQTSRGLDVIGRINYARTPERLEELRALVLGTINGLARECCATREIDPARIACAAMAGNTTMTHLLLGLPPEHIRLEPYTPTLREVPILEAREVGLDILPTARVFLSPAVGSYVGGDIMSGLTCTELAGDSEDITLFLDIGTNGELAVGNREFLMACACSAGPAFEGAGLDCGMPAMAGAVERVHVDAATGLATFSTIGDAPARGICGSGVISLMAGLFRTGWLDQAGRLDRSRPCPAIEADGRRARYVLARQADGAERDVCLSETDLENVIRAKAAIFSATRLLLSTVGLDFGDVSAFVIAGGFGRFLDVQDAVTIGLLPDIERAKFRYAGNASLAGARLALLSRGKRRQQLELARRTTYVELMTHREYMDEYTAALFLPHTEASLFPSMTARRTS